MEYLFTAYGHKNILATHKTTLEFTKDREASLRGDCIAGVNSDFDVSAIKDFIRELGNNKSIKIIIKTDRLTHKSGEDFFQIVNATLNPDFKNNRELVIRKSDFISKRTFATNADKSAADLSREFIKKLKNPEQKIIVSVVGAPFKM